MLKFRAWNKKEQKFIHSDWKYGELSFWENVLQDFSKEYEPVQQFTGLKDKNEKEIFVGDIIRIFPGYGCEWGEYIGEIVFYNFSFVIKSMRRYNSLSFIDYECPKPEIIGNIFENPEFLEEKVK